MIIGCPATAIPGELVRADKFRVPMITTTSISHPFKGPPVSYHPPIDPGMVPSERFLILSTSIMTLSPQC